MVCKKSRSLLPSSQCLACTGYLLLCFPTQLHTLGWLNISNELASTPIITDHQREIELGSNVGSEIKEQQQLWLLAESLGSSKLGKGSSCSGLDGGKTG